MKKIILTGVALMAFAAAGFAQNTSTVNQDGTSQTAQVGQVGTLQKSTITQKKLEGNNSGNYATTIQGTSGAPNTTGMNEAIVNQNNGSNSNRAGITQSGKGNKGTIQQSDNSGGDGTAVTGGSSAAAVKAAGGNFAGILQSGTDNTETAIIQSNTSSANFGEIYQYGDNNRETGINQSDNSTGNTATIKQGTASVGANDNLARVSQQGGSSDNTATVTQTATGNDAVTTQNDDSNNNKATVNQFADGNQATIQQRNSSFGNSADITQKSDRNAGQYNTAVINQNNNSHDNQASILQTSNGAMATINQIDNSADNLASIKQGGTADAGRSEAIIDQVNAYDPTPGAFVAGQARGNKATIEQNTLNNFEGFGNFAHIRQGRSGAVVSDNNVASIHQEYSRNTARLEQVGIGNTGTVFQTGDRNVVQNGNGEPGSFALQEGNLNTLTITQNAGSDGPYSPGVANVTQMGNSNSATITQSRN